MVWVAIIAALIAVFVGFLIGVSSKKTVTVPGPTVTVTATVTSAVTVTAVPVSDNLSRLEAAWFNIDSASKDSIRSTWKSAKGNATSENVVITTMMNALITNAPSLNAYETRQFLDWTLTH